MIERSERLIHKFSLKCCMTDYILSYALLKIILLNEKKIEGNKELKKESLEYLGEFINNYFQNCLEGYYDCLTLFVNNNTNDVVNNILDFQSMFNTIICKCLMNPFILSDCSTDIRRTCKICPKIAP